MSRENRGPLVLSAIVLIGLVLVISMGIAAAVALVGISTQLAALPALNAWATVRLPLLLGAEAIVFCLVTACILALPFIVLIMRRSVYSKASVLLMKAMGLCFFLMLVPALFILLLLLIRGLHSCLNIYLICGMVLAVLSGSIFWLFAALIRQGSHYKEENELTI